MQSAQSTPILSVRRIVITAILSAISMLLGLTRLGYIPVPNLAGNATIMHVPVIIGGSSRRSRGRNIGGLDLWDYQYVTRRGYDFRRSPRLRSAPLVYRRGCLL